MEMKMVAYKRCMGDYGSTYYEKLNLTGRWALDLIPGNTEYALFLEYKGWFLKHWVHEDRVEILPEHHSIIMECGKGD